MPLWIARHKVPPLAQVPRHSSAAVDSQSTNHCYATTAFECSSTFLLDSPRCLLLGAPSDPAVAAALEAATQAAVARLEALPCAPDQEASLVSGPARELLRLLLEGMPQLGHSEMASAVSRLCLLVGREATAEDAERIAAEFR